MSKLFLVNVDLNKNQLLNAVLHTLASAPGSPVAGQLYYDSTNTAPYFYNGAAFISMDASKVANGYIPLAKLATDPLARANHTGTQLANTISNFDTQVRTNTLNQMAAPTAAVSMNSQKITNLAAPTVSGDAAEYTWVLGQINASAAGLDVKQSVRVATTANLSATYANGSSGVGATLTNMPNTLDGVSLAANDRILVKDQTTGFQNGIYTVTTLGTGANGVWTRATDCDTPTEYNPGVFALVEEGTTNGASQWKVTTTGTFVIGTTNVAWGQFGAGSAYTAGNGLTLGGSTFNVGAGTGITVNADDVAVDTTVVVRKFLQTLSTSAASYTVTHNLNSTSVMVAVINASTGEVVEADVTNATVNTVTVAFATAPAANAYKVAVFG
jgi:hypothetical protein